MPRGFLHFGMLWLGKKLVKLREKLTIKRGLMAEDEEKPFLDHLEDLRQTLMRMIIVLIIAVVLCFVFEKQLLEIIQFPARSAKVGWPDTKTLPTGISQEDWFEVKKIARGLIDLPEGRETVWLEHAAGADLERLRPHAQALRIYSTALLLPESSRDAFVRAALDKNQAALESGLEMLAKKPDARLDRAVVERKGDIINMLTLGVAEGFNTTLKVSLYAGLTVSFPFLLYFLLLFVLPGLKREERKVLWPSLAIGFGLFLIGVCFAYFIVLPRALGFFHSYTQAHGWSADFRISNYVSFVTQVTFIFGLGFELPVVVYALIRLGLLSFSTMRRTRGYAVLIIAVVSAIVTPTPDAATMLALTVPLIILYEICIWLAWFHERAEKRREAADEAERRARRERANLAAAYPAGADASSEASADAHADARAESAHPDLEHGDHEASTTDAYHAGIETPEPHQPELPFSSDDHQAEHGEEEPRDVVETDFGHDSSTSTMPYGHPGESAESPESESSHPDTAAGSPEAEAGPADQSEPGDTDRSG